MTFATTIRRLLVPVLGAAAFSSLCVLGAVAPAVAGTPAAPATPAGWQGAVEERLDAALTEQAAAFPSAVRRQADVALRFDADGRFAGATLAQGSGSRLLDARAVVLAAHLAYPPLPADAARSVTMRMVFGRPLATTADRRRFVAQAAAVAARGTRLAAR